MSQQEVDRIKNLLSNFSIDATFFEHEPVITSEDAARVRGIALKCGVKAILFTNGSDFVIVDVPADLKINERKVCAFLNWDKKQIRMATREEVLEITGCEVGSVPPFGHKTSLKLLVDSKVFDNEFNDFNVGLRTHSLKIKSTDLKNVFEKLNASFGDFVRGS